MLTPCQSYQPHIQSTMNVNSLCVADCVESDDVCLEDRESLEAIRTLHQQIDDDESGNIDLDESQEVGIVECATSSCCLSSIMFLCSFFGQPFYFQLGRNNMNKYFI